MVCKTLILLFLGSCLFLITLSARAQRNIVSWSAQASLGSTLFYGDIRQNDFIPVLRNKNELRVGCSLGLSRQFNRYIGLKGLVSFGSLSGTKRSADQYFISRFTEFGFNVMVRVDDLILSDLGKSGKSPFNLYFLIGWALMDFRTEIRKLSDGSFVKGLGRDANGRKGKATTELVIPLGLGMKYNLASLSGTTTPFTKRSDLEVEFIIKNVNSDKVDYEVNYLSGKDKYYLLTAGFSYQLSQKK